ncbi:arsenate-mycothiol transferase ArsC [Sediminicola luteus]|uniref:Protein-tyrosine-phosphatase n=1 Tax=Sediminicola luteus TaxID=319238 RepID=A0A2A4G6Z4_9FLAO|nr:protein-tyrosine-phosphatase [Sediminicola luteus]PCE63748.1 protein-tyrosine-phosphatase [Sediminicola luteus]
MYPTITQHLNQLAAVPEDRKAVLQPLIEQLQSKKDKGEAIRLNFICTHNSRRSHLSQIWAQVAAHKYGLDKVVTYSGGTEATAMFPKVAETLIDQGFTIDTLSQGDNPVYMVRFDENEAPIIGFSKRFDYTFNPQSGFTAIMTCSQADEGCPFIAGAEKRVPITYEDPKVSDGTPEQAVVYAERSLQIASEMDYVFSQVV